LICRSFIAKKAQIQDNDNPEKNMSLQLKGKVNVIKNKIKDLRRRMEADKKVRNRYLIMALASVFVLDYLMFCYHTDKNVFNIFPSIPLFEETRAVNVFLPSTDGKSLIEEKRDIPIFKDNELYVKYLFEMVVKGSRYDNTSIAVPVNLFVRKIWIYESADSLKRCVVDLEPPVRDGSLKVIEGSEALFKKALEKTLLANISTISRLEILERGVPDKRLWEM